MSEAQPETKKIRCSMCNVLTNHSLRARYSWFRQIGEYEEPGDSARELCEHRHSIWACAGCETVTFEWQLIYPDGWEGDGGYFPTYQVPPKVFRNLNPELSRLHHEVVACLNKDHLLLCTIGLRVLIEGVCVDKGLTDGNLEKRVDGLIKFLPSVNLVEALHTFRITGNDAAHRLEALSYDDAKAAIEVMEDVLNFLYDLDYKASLVRNTWKRAGLKSVTPGSVQ